MVNSSSILPSGMNHGLSVSPTVRVNSTGSYTQLIVIPLFVADPSLPLMVMPSCCWASASMLANHAGVMPV